MFGLVVIEVMTPSGHLSSGVFSTGAIGTIYYYCHCPLAPAILGQSITVSTRSSKVLNTPLPLMAFIGL